MKHEEIDVELFAGGGGVAAGMRAALGRSAAVAINHDKIAMDVYRANYGGLCLPEDVWHRDPSLVTKGRRVRLLWASPDCRHFSRARSGAPRSKSIRSLPFVIVRWAEKVRPRIIIVENVLEFVGWGPLYEVGHRLPSGHILAEGDKLVGQPIPERKGETFNLWRGRLELLGYRFEWRILDASDYAAPTRRRRFVGIARCDGEPIVWPEATHGPGRLPYRTAGECIDWSVPAPSIFERKRPLKAGPLRRIAAGIRKFMVERPPYLAPTRHPCRDNSGPVASFLAKHYGGHESPGSSLAEPLSTITAQDHHYLVNVTLAPGDTVQPDKVAAFLVVYYNTNVGQHLDAPMRTVTPKDRFGLVTVSGRGHVIVDIGQRMLTTGELLRAQFGRHAEGYNLEPARTETKKRALIGNSVCPDMAEAVIRANVGGREPVRRAA